MLNPEYEEEYEEEDYGEEYGEEMDDLGYMDLSDADENVKAEVLKLYALYKKSKDPEEQALIIKRVYEVTGTPMPEELGDEYEGEGTLGFDPMWMMKMKKRAEEAAKKKMSEIMKAGLPVWKRRADLQKAFPDPTGKDMTRFLAWIKKFGHKEEPSLAKFRPAGLTKLEKDLKQWEKMYGRRRPLLPEGQLRLHNITKHLPYEEREKIYAKYGLPKPPIAKPRGWPKIKIGKLSISFKPNKKIREAYKKMKKLSTGPIVKKTKELAVKAVKAVGKALKFVVSWTPLVRVAIWSLQACRKILRKNPKAKKKYKGKYNALAKVVQKASGVKLTLSGLDEPITMEDLAILQGIGAIDEIDSEGLGALVAISSSVSAAATALLAAVKAFAKKVGAGELVESVIEEMKPLDPEAAAVEEELAPEAAAIERKIETKAGEEAIKEIAKGEPTSKALVAKAGIPMPLIFGFIAGGLGLAWYIWKGRK